MNDETTFQQNLHKQNCLKGCLFIAFKFLVFSIFRYLLAEYGQWKESNYYFDDALNMVFLVSYLFCLIIFGAFVQLTDNFSLIIVNCLMFTIETIIVLNSSYSSFMMFLLLSISVYIFIIGVIFRGVEQFGIGKALMLFLLQTLTVMMIILIFFREKLNNGEILNGNINVFLGLQTYVLWLTFFIMDESKKEQIGGLKICLGVGHDVVTVLWQIVSELSLEWNDSTNNAEVFEQLK